MIERLIRDLLKEIGEDPDREGLVKTPERVERMFAFLTSGYGKQVDDVLNQAVFQDNYDEIVVVKDIDFFSLCEHHLLPFTPFFRQVSRRLLAGRPDCRVEQVGATGGDV